MAPQHRNRHGCVWIRWLQYSTILDRANREGFGFIAALLALVSIPLVGLTIPFGLAVAAVGIQMIAGRPQPWLPTFGRGR